MDEREVRRIIVEGLDAGGVTKLKAAKARAEFLDGVRDLRIDELGMDSLARMELCIAIELGTGVSIASRELADHRSLGALAEAVAGRCHA